MPVLAKRGTAHALSQRCGGERTGPQSEPPGRALAMPVFSFAVAMGAFGPARRQFFTRSIMKHVATMACRAPIWFWA